MAPEALQKAPGDALEASAGPRNDLQSVDEPGEAPRSAPETLPGGPWEAPGSSRDVPGSVLGSSGSVSEILLAAFWTSEDAAGAEMAKVWILLHLSSENLFFRSPGNRKSFRSGPAEVSWKLCRARESGSERVRGSGSKKSASKGLCDPAELTGTKVSRVQKLPIWQCI